MPRPKITPTITTTPVRNGTHRYDVACPACPGFKRISHVQRIAETIAIRHSERHYPPSPRPVPAPTMTITPDAAKGGQPCFVVRCSHCPTFTRQAYHQPIADRISARHVEAHAAEGLTVTGS